MHNQTLNIHPSQLVQLPTNPTVSEAVEYMKTSIDIVDWNLKRRRVKVAVGPTLWLNGFVPSNDSYVSRIDCQGLIRKVLGKAKRAPKSTNHKPFKYKKK